ncbi:MAG: DNA polymerase, partial [Pyrinomonadaceae bacterium]
GTNDYQLITTAEGVHLAAEQLANHSVLGLDTETTELDPYRGRMRLVQLAAPDGVRIFDLDQFGENLAEDPGLAPLRDLLASTRPVKIAHNAKFDAKWVKHRLGVELGAVYDTYLASQIISAGNSDDRHGLAAVSERYLQTTVDKSEQRSDWGGALSDSQLRYAALDASVLLPLRSAQMQRLQSDGLDQCAHLEFDCVLPLTQLELNGFYLDADRWRIQLRWVEKERARIADELQEMLAEGAVQGSLFGRAEINLDSHTQLTEVLVRLGIPMPDSTRNWKLQPLAAEYPVIAKLLEYRTVQKAQSSYGETMLAEINPKTGRIHADFRQIGAPTGRMACNNPNIQQIPHGVEYRRCFRAPEGRKLCIADYSQIELRILAQFSEDRGFLDAFISGADLHRTTAAQVFGVKPDEVTSDQRNFAKRLNFGVVYGIGSQRFAMLTGVANSEAEDLLKKYFNTYRQLDAWLRDASNRAVRDASIRTMSGRLIKFRFDRHDRQAVSGVQRGGKNAPVQGTSADILKRAMRILHDRLRGTSGMIVNVVHDEIVVEVDAGDAEAMAEIMRTAMAEAGQEFVNRVPVNVDVEIADEWVK